MFFDYLKRVTFIIGYFFKNLEEITIKRGIERIARDNEPLHDGENDQNKQK